MKNVCGRYNRPGLSCYYITDTKDGAKKEVYKHVCEKERSKFTAQIANVKVDFNIRLLDLSVIKKEYGNFYKYLQNPVAEINDNWPKEYLLSNYVADCCRVCGYDGIKYCGDANYCNYVLWKENGLTIISSLDD